MFFTGRLVGGFWLALWRAIWISDLIRPPLLKEKDIISFAVSLELLTKSLPKFDGRKMRAGFQASLRKARASVGLGRLRHGSCTRVARGIATHGRMEPPLMERRGDSEKLVRDLKANFPGEQIGIAKAVLDSHGKDESFHPPVAPDAVFFPKSTEEVQAAVVIAGEADCCIVPWGAGTSLEGHVAALQVRHCAHRRDLNSSQRGLLVYG